MSASQFSHTILAQIAMTAPPDAMLGMTPDQARQLVVEFLARQAPPMPVAPIEVARDAARWRFVRDIMLRFPTKRGDGVLPWVYAMSWHSLEELRPEAFDRLVDEVMQSVASGVAGNGALEALLHPHQSEPTSEPIRTENPPDSG